MPVISTRSGTSCLPPSVGSYRSSSSTVSERTSSYSSGLPDSYLNRTTFRSSLLTTSSSSSSSIGGSSYRRSSLTGNDTTNRTTSTSASRFGVSKYTRSSFDRDLPPSGSRYRSESRTRDSDHQSSSSSSSFARNLATSGADLYEKYSPAHYIPKCELSRSRSLSEANKYNNKSSSPSGSSSATSDFLLQNNSNKVLKDDPIRQRSATSPTSKSSLSTLTSSGTGANAAAIGGSSAAISKVKLCVPHSSFVTNQQNLHQLVNNNNSDSFVVATTNNKFGILTTNSTPTTTTTTTSTTDACSPSPLSASSLLPSASIVTPSKLRQLTTDAANAAAAAQGSNVYKNSNNNNNNNNNSVMMIRPSNNDRLKGGGQMLKNRFSASTAAPIATTASSPFFTYKDTNFLKCEYELARSQVVKSQEANNNNNNINNNNNNALYLTENQNLKQYSSSAKSLVHQQSPASYSKLKTQSKLSKLTSKIPGNDNNNKSELEEITNTILKAYKTINPENTVDNSTATGGTNTQDRKEKMNNDDDDFDENHPHSTKHLDTPSTDLLVDDDIKFIDSDDSEQQKLIKSTKTKPTILPATKVLESLKSSKPIATSSASSTLPLSASKKQENNYKAANKYNTLNNIRSIHLIKQQNGIDGHDKFRSQSNESLNKNVVVVTPVTFISSSSQTSSTASPTSSSSPSSSSSGPSGPAGISAPTENVGLSTVTGSDTPNDKLTGKIWEVNGSIRSSSLRNALPPVSPVRSWERDRSRYRELLDNDYDGTAKSTVSFTSSSLKPSSTLLSNSSILNDAYDKLTTDSAEGLCGLRNIGNTCFMNSVIQCLSNTNDLTKFLKSQKDPKSTTKDQRIFSEFVKLIKEMWQPTTRSVTPMELKSAFSSKHRMYSGCAQQDAQEFLRFFLDSLHTALNAGTKAEGIQLDDNLSDHKKADLMWEWYSKTENSVIKDLFVGQLKSSLKCTQCGNTSVTFDPFWDLSLPLPSTSRCKLENCLELFIREEILDGDEMPTCSKCQQRRKCTKSFTIQRFPKYLVIHLKRFSETRWSKLTNIVEFPIGEKELNLAPYASNTNSSSALYSLYAISNHMGSTAGGHYVALCKHPQLKKWHEFNDNIVSDANESSLVSSSAYLLFYERAQQINRINSTHHRNSRNNINNNIKVAPFGAESNIFSNNDYFGAKYYFKNDKNNFKILTNNGFNGNIFNNIINNNENNNQVILNFVIGILFYSICIIVWIKMR